MSRRPYLPLGLAAIAAALIIHGGSSLASETIIKTERELHYTKVIIQQDRQLKVKDQQVRQKDAEVKVKDQQVRQAQAVAASALAVPHAKPAAARPAAVPTTTTEPVPASDEPAGKATTSPEPEVTVSPSPSPSPVAPSPQPTEDVPASQSPSPEPSASPPDDDPPPSEDPSEDPGLKILVSLSACLALWGGGTLAQNSEITTRRMNGDDTA